MKVLIKKKNKCYKIVNNHKTKIYHINGSNNHIVSKEWSKIYSELSPIYDNMENDFMAIDMIDLIFYERWLNG